LLEYKVRHFFVNTSQWVALQVGDAAAGLALVVKEGILTRQHPEGSPWDRDSQSQKWQQGDEANSGKGEVGGVWGKEASMV
jgi:hypothetical protein